MQHTTRHFSVPLDHSNSHFGTFLAEQGIANLDTTTYPLVQFRYPLLLSIFYVITVYLFTPKPKVVEKDASKIKKKDGFLLKFFMLAHNLGLCLFSLYCFVESIQITLNLFSTYGWKQTTCVEWEKTFNAENSKFGFLCWIFYISKYYEFLDTYIHFFKGRGASNLQVYHHFGAVYATWLCMATRSTGGYLFINLNSFIHTIMYAYYFCSILKIRFPINKNIITSMQMIQFWVGNIISVTQIIRFNECMSREDIFAILYNNIYTSVLFVMFLSFYIKSYCQKRGNKNEKRQKKE